MSDSGHISIPFDAEDVAAVLCSASLDIGDLCLSANVNPDSLIKPSYASGPAFAPEHFRDGFDDTRLPDSGSDDWYYTRGKWGYSIPTVGTPRLISAVRGKAWVHTGPLGSPWLCLAHFDGYRHNAKARLPMTAAVTAGAKIVMTIVTGTPQPDITAPGGRGNAGGVVAVPEVLGDVRIGCSVYENGTFRGAYIAGSSVAQSDTGVHTVETAITAQGNRTYTVIPWATDGSSPDQSGAHFFGLMLAAGISGALETTTTAQAIPAVGLRVTNPATYAQQGRIELEITLQNPQGTGIPHATFTGFRLYRGADTQVPSQYFWVYADDGGTYATADEGETVTVEGVCTDPALMTAGQFVTLHLRAACSGVSGDLQSTAVTLGDLTAPEVS